jgi:hypothetical protein
MTTPMHHASRMGLLRLWLSDNGGLAILTLVTLVLALGCGAYLLPMGPPEHLVGIVRDVKFGGGKSTYDRVAYVELGHQAVTVIVPLNACAVGDRISLERQPRLWGSSLIADLLPCSSRR